MKFRVLVAGALVLAVVALAASAIVKGQKISYEGELVRDLSRKR